ncbi:ABC transporter substrate-binding protein [Ornithinibacillus sp. JPR2-1]|uniref:ABC transporter substrate-binding protein n=1 Tax=Ornithinibacillus sp. JPR2-1 TaxID=2094019 RepID=UPI0031D7D2F9
MKYRDHLKVLMNYFKLATPVETTIADLANLLNCSERHTKTVMKSLQEQGDIKWDVHKGRGKKPQLTILLSEEQLLFQEAKKLAVDGKYRAAFELARSLHTYQDLFNQWFEADLGILKKTEEKEELDVLRYPFYETNLSLDPLNIFSRHDSHIVQQIFDRLVEYDAQSETLLPRIARNWESDDGKRWTFYLNKGVRFHHGRELTSKDVMDTIGRLPQNHVIMRVIKEIHTPNPYVVIFHLDQVDYLFPRYLSGMKLSIVPMELILDDESHFRTNPIGSGPYRLTVHDENLVRLDIFPDYYRERPWLDRIEMIKTNDFQPEAPHPLLLRAPDESWQEHTEVEEGADFIILNCNRALMKEIHVRKQICQLINPTEFCLENEMVAHSFLSYRSMAKDEDESLPCSTNVNGKITLTIAAQEIRDGVNHEREALIFQEQLKRVGIASTIDILNVKDLCKPDVLMKYDVVVGGIALSEDKLLSLIMLMQSNELAVFPSLDEETKRTVHSYIERIRMLPDDLSRWKVYVELEEYLKEAHILYFLTHRSHTIYQPKNSEYVHLELDHHGRVDYRKVWKRYG